MKKILLSIMSFCLMAGVLHPTIKAQETFDVSFQCEYATIGDTLNLQISGVDQNDCEIIWKSDGEVFLENQTSYQLSSYDMQTLIEVEVKANDQTVSEKILISDLPVVYIDVENGATITSKEDYLNANIKITGNDKYGTELYYEGITEIKGRGNSTWNLPKKPYRLKLDEKASLFGISKSKHWVLLANYLDESLLRNQIAHELGEAYDLYSVKSTFVDVVMNGEKIGNYQLAEHIRVDKNRVDVFDWEALGEDIAKDFAKEHQFTEELSDELEEKMTKNLQWITTGTYHFYPNDFTIDDYTITIADYVDEININGGYLIELDDSLDELSVFQSSLAQPMMIKSPEYLYTNEDMMNYLKNYINDFETSIQNQNDFTVQRDGKKVHYSDLFDLDSLLSYFLIQEIMFNYDSMKRSTYMYKDIDDKMKMGPVWDFDFSSGSEQVFEYYDRWETLYFNVDTQSKSWYKFLIKDPYFLAKLRYQYWKYRDELEKMIKKEGVIDTYADYLSSSGKLNAQLWHDYDPFENQVHTFKEWLTNRSAWLDDQFATQASIASSLQYQNYRDFNISYRKVKDGVDTSISYNEYQDLLLPENYDLMLHMDDVASYDLYVNEDYYGRVSDGSILTKDDLFANDQDVSVLVLKASDGMTCSYVVTKDTNNEIDTIAPNPVNNFKASNVDTNSLTLSWDASDADDVDSYLIYLDNYNDALVSTSDVTYQVSDLDANHKYVFRIVVKDKSGNLSQPSMIEVTTLKELEIVEPVSDIDIEQISYKEIKLSWQPCLFATEYDIYRKGYKETSQFEYVDTVKDCLYHMTGLKTGKQYSYYIVAKNEEMCAEASPIVIYATALTGNVQLGLTKLSDTKFKLSWNKIDGATRYIIYRKRNDDAYKKVLTLGGEDLTYTTSEMPSGNYSYIVKAGRYDSKDRVMTGASNEVKGMSVYAVPEIDTKSLDSKKIEVSWKKVEGVTHYEVYRATSLDGKYTKFTTTKNLSYTFTSLTKGKKYFFKLRGYKSYNNDKIYTRYSEVKSMVAK